MRCSFGSIVRPRTRRASIQNYFSTSRDGYQSVGSFHNESLVDLIQQDDLLYQTPPLPFQENHDLELQPNNDVPHAVHHMIDRKRWTFMNHGAFGGALSSAHHRAQQWREYLELQPLRYHDRDLLPHLVYAYRRLAKFMNADRTHIAPSPNATYAINAVLSSLARRQQPVHAVTWDTSYGSVKTMVNFYFPQSSSSSASVIPFQQHYLPRLMVDDRPLVGEARRTIVKALDDHVHLLLEKDGPLTSTLLQDKIPLLILDHSTSNTAINMPIAALAHRWKERLGPDALVLVDGAHGLLAQDIDMKKLSSNVDFYISNGHKWLSAPRGVAVLVAAPKHHAYLYPAVASHGLFEADLFSRFVWDGTRDYCAALSLPVVLDHWEKVGSNTGVDVRQELRQMLRLGLEAMCDEWLGHLNFQDLLIVPFDLVSPMALVRIPGLKDRRHTSTDAKVLQDYLYSQHCIEAPIKCINDRLYARVSCHVYNTTDDFVRLARAIDQYCKNC